MESSEPNEYTKKLEQLKTWRKETPSKKSQGRFPGWVREYVMAITPEFGVLRLSTELDIGQRTILRWMREADKNLTSKVQEKPLQAYLGEDALKVVNLEKNTIKIAINHHGLDLNATINKAQLEAIIAIIFQES